MQMNSTHENPIVRRAENFQDANMIKAANLYSFFLPMEGSEGTLVRYEGKDLIMTGSNNYLGLTHDPRVKAAAKAAIDKFGTGCTGSRFLNGNSVLHNELEQRLAKFVGKENGLVMTTGFLTNYSSINTIVEEGDYILSDAENHASIIAGCKSSRATTITFKHNDVSDLRKKLGELPADAAKLIVADGVFSMTGEIVDLPGIVAVKREFKNVMIMLDDAHALGVLGNQGRGTADHFGLTDEVDFITVTFSKSFASLGGFIAGPDRLIDYIRHKARGFIFSAALPPSATATALKVLDILESDESVLASLRANVKFMREGFEEMGLPVFPSETPIISVKVGDEGKALMMVKALQAAGVFSTPVLFPAVPFGNAMIRTSYMASHSRPELEKVLAVWSKLAHKFGIIVEKGTVVKTEETGKSGYGFETLAARAR